MKIESVNNAKVKEWMKLKGKKYRDLTNEFIIEGDHLLTMALEAHAVKEIIALDETFQMDDIPFYKVTENIMKKLSCQASYPKVMAICKKLEEKEIVGNVCVLDCIQDPGNLGTIIRSAVAFHIETLILSKDTVDLYNEKVIRATEGMVFKINVIRANLEDKLKELKENGYSIYGTNVRHGLILKDLAKSEKMAIIIGNEGQGMKESLNAYCDDHILIPIHVESLNAAVAASIIFYEMER